MRGSRAPTVHLAGWLFADLMLVLFLVALISLPLTSAQRPHPKPHPTPHPTPSPTKSADRELSLDAARFCLKADYGGMLHGAHGTKAANDALLGRLRDRLKANDLQDRQAGLVLTFGTGSQGDIGTAKRVAQRANETIRDRQDHFDKIVERHYWSGGPRGYVQMEVFFFNRPGDEPPPPPREKCPFEH